MSDHTPTTAPAPVLTPELLSDDMIRQMIHEANAANRRARIDARTMESTPECVASCGDAAYCETIRSYLSQAGVTLAREDANRCLAQEGHREAERRRQKAEDAALVLSNKLGDAAHVLKAVRAVLAVCRREQRSEDDGHVYAHIAEYLKAALKGNVPLV